LLDDGTSRGACSFAAMCPLIVRQRPRGACREQCRRGQCGHQECPHLGAGGRGAHVRYTSRYCSLQNAQPGSNSLQIGILTSFRYVFASPRPEIPTPPVKFCMYVPLRPHRSAPCLCSSNARLDFELGGPQNVVSPPPEYMELDPNCLAATLTGPLALSDLDTACLNSRIVEVSVLDALMVTIGRGVLSGAVDLLDPFATLFPAPMGCCYTCPAGSCRRGDARPQTDYCVGPRVAAWAAEGALKEKKPCGVSNNGADCPCARR